MFKKRTAGPAFKPKVGPRARPAASTPAADSPASTPVSTTPTSATPIPDTPAASAPVSASPTPSHDGASNGNAIARDPKGQSTTTSSDGGTPHDSQRPSVDILSQSQQTAVSTQAPVSAATGASSVKTPAVGRPRARPRIFASKNEAPSVPASERLEAALQVTASSTPSQNSAPESSSHATPDTSSVRSQIPAIATPEPSQAEPVPISRPVQGKTRQQTALLTPEPSQIQRSQVPEIDNIPELHTTASTPTSSSDSQSTPISSAAVSIAGSETGDVTPTIPPVTRKRKSPQSSLDADSSKTPAKRVRKPRLQTSIELASDPISEFDAQPTAAPPRQPRRRGTSNYRRFQRSETPPDSEKQTIDIQKLTMADLTRDLRIGKKFSRHDELKEREKQARAKTPGSKAGASPAPVPVTPLAPLESSRPSGGPKFHTVNGQIVVDQSSLVVDRHADADAAREGMIEMEEDDFTRLITSNSFRTGSKLRGPNHWTAEDTEKFYHALKMFGTDFEMISNMFPGRTRRHVKLKFNREEKLAPQRINSCLVGEKKVKMDMNAYVATSGIAFESVEDIQAAQDALAAQHEAEERRVIEEHEAEMREKREALFREDNADKDGIVTIEIDGDAPIDFGKMKKSGIRMK